MTIHETYHAGFQVGDHVEVNMGRWLPGYIVQEFLNSGKRVKVKCKDCEYQNIVDFSEIRHPNLVRESK